VRLLRIYGATARVLASYLALRAVRSFMSTPRYAAALEQRHRRNARRIQRTIVSAGGLFIKVGQLISIMTNFLPPEFRGELEGLQDRLPPRPFEEIEARLRSELSAPPDELFPSFDRTPIATASLAQVHAATLHDGRRVAVKVQHADIERVAQEDLRTIGRILALIHFFTGLRGLESYHPEICEMIGEELDFRREAKNIARVRAHFADEPGVRVPVVVAELSTTRVLVTEFVDGTKITDFAGLAARGLDRRDLAARVVAAYCRMMFIDGVYHADPHPGNIFVGADGAIVFVDFGAVGVLSPQMKEGMPLFLEGMIRRDTRQIVEAIRQMGFVSLDMPSEKVARRVLDWAQRRFLEQLSNDSFQLGDVRMTMESKLEALADLRKLDVSFRQLTASFQVPKSWVLLERTLLLLLGLCTELDPTWNPMLVIRPYLEEVVLGEDRDWEKLVRASLGDIARRAVTIPEDLHRALERTNQGELEIRVPEINTAARLIVGAAHQLIWCVIAVSAGLTAYQAYDRGRDAVATILTVATVAALLAMLRSMRSSR
jgi:ubiquinone biosynthesis protein